MNKRIQVILPEEIADEIQATARKETRSISNFVKKLIIKELENERKTTSY